MTLNLFPVRAPIGRATMAGQQFDVMMTPEFSRALADLFERVGGVSSPSLTTVVKNLDDVTNIVEGIGGNNAFVEQANVEPNTTHFFDVPMTISSVDAQVIELRMLLEQAASALADLDVISQRIKSFAIQSAFVADVPPSPLQLAPDATDLPTVITLANSLKQALLSNGIGS